MTVPSFSAPHRSYQLNQVWAIRWSRCSRRGRRREVEQKQRYRGATAFGGGVARRVVGQVVIWGCKRVRIERVDGERWSGQGVKEHKIGRLLTSAFMVVEVSTSLWCTVSGLRVL
jgi:hypothetical protein